MNNILEQINQLLFPPSLHNVAVASDQDPVIRLLSSLHSGRGIEVNLQGREDVFIDNFAEDRRYKTNYINVNVDKDLQKMDKPSKIPNLFSNQRQSDFPTQQQKAILVKLKKVPIYTVVNGYNEIVIASPRVMPPKNTMEWLYDKYHDNFVWKYDKGPVSVGLFFVNKEDAETYMQEICKKDPKGAETIGLSVKTVGLDTFYELNRTSKPKMQAKLVADLEEIDLFLNEYFNNKFIDLHPKQKYDRNWFQGNPIYMIRVNEHLSGVDQKQMILGKYNFDDSFPNSKKILLFKRDDAFKVWELYRSKYKDLKLPEEPNLQVYNLENYLLDLEKGDISLTENTIIVPPYESYKYSKFLAEQSKESKTISMQESLEKYCATQVKSFQRFYKGIVWLITSDTLPSEDNSW